MPRRLSPIAIQRRVTITGMMMLIIVASLCARAAHADNITAQATGTENLSWASNPLMAISGAQALWGSTTSPELLLKAATSKSTASLDTRLDENVFNQSAYNSSDIHATAQIGTANQHWNVQLQQHTDYDTTRTSELTTYGQSALVARRTGLSLAPQISYMPTTVDSLILPATAAVSTYDRNNFTNYENFDLAPTYKHQFNARHTGVLLIDAQRYQSLRGPHNSVDSLGPSAGWEMLLSPRFTVNASAGAQTSRQFQSGASNVPWKWQSTFNAGLAFQGLQDTINATASRAQVPYGNGTEALQTSLVASESHVLTKLFSANLSGTYLNATYQTDTSGSLKSEIIGKGGITYHATDHLDLTTSYQYRGETLTQNSAKIHDNSGMIQLVYKPKQWTFTP